MDNESLVHHRADTDTLNIGEVERGLLSLVALLGIQFEDVCFSDKESPFLCFAAFVDLCMYVCVCVCMCVQFKI